MFPLKSAVDPLLKGLLPGDYGNSSIVPGPPQEYLLGIAPIGRFCFRWPEPQVHPKQSRKLA